MRLGRILYPIKALGPGNRLGIWLQGCEKKCEGCTNPDLQSMDKPHIPLEILTAMCRSAISAYHLDGISISGGEPFLQAEELSKLLEELTPFHCNVLIFSGYTIEELKEKKDPYVDKLLSLVDVLVDGPFIKERNRGELLRGSDNQRILYFNPDVKDRFEEYISLDRHIIDSFIAEDGVVVVGVHPNGFIR